MSKTISFVLKSGKYKSYYVDTNEVKTITDLKCFLWRCGVYFHETDKLVLNKRDFNHRLLSVSLDSMGDHFRVNDIRSADEVEIIAKTESERKVDKLDNQMKQLSEENNSLREELSALKASKDTIETEVKNLRDEWKDMNEVKESVDNVVIEELRQELLSLKETNERNESQLKELTEEINSTEKSGSETDRTSGGKGSHNPLNTTFGDKDVMEMFNEILKHIQKTNDLMNDMNGEKDKALTALEGIRQVVDNTDTESMASVQTISENMYEMKTQSKTYAQMSGNCVDSESVANTSISSSIEDILQEPMADKISWFVLKYSQKLSQMTEVWKSLSGISSSLRSEVMDEMLAQFTDQLTVDKNKIFS